MKLPFIFIFDIDGTIIGNIHQQILEWRLINYIDNSWSKKCIFFKKMNKFIVNID